jgi:hypothetical protein
MVEENGGGAGVASNFIWAIALILIVMIVMGALYYGGILSGRKKTEVDVNVFCTHSLTARIKDFQCLDSTGIEAIFVSLRLNLKNRGETKVFTSPASYKYY